MSSIDDEIVRAKMRKLRVSTFADIFYEVVNDEAYADALPEDIFLAAVEEAYTQRQQRNIAKAITQAKFRYPDASLAEITRAEQRGINMRQLKRIAATNWRETRPTYTSSHRPEQARHTLPAPSASPHAKPDIPWRTTGWINL